MTQNWKKLLSLLLVLTMLVGMMPAVFAAEEEPEQAEEILTEEPAEPEVPAEPETPEEPAEPAEPEAPAPAAEEEAAPLTLKAARRRPSPSASRRSPQRAKRLRRTPGRRRPSRPMRQANTCSRSPSPGLRPGTGWSRPPAARLS